MFTARQIRKISKRKNLTSQVYDELMYQILEEATAGKDRVDLTWVKPVPIEILEKVRRKLERRGFLVAGENCERAEWTILFDKNC